MWIFLNNGFFSIVDKGNEPGKLMVRARIKGDLERVFRVSSARVFRTPKADYLYRAMISRERVANIIRNEVATIDYDNFKDSIDKKDHARKYAYSGVWAEMFDWQGKEEPEAADWWCNYREDGVSLYKEEYKYSEEELIEHQTLYPD